MFDNQFQKDANHRSKATENCVFHLIVTSHHRVFKKISSVQNKYYIAQYQHH